MAENHIKPDDNWARIQKQEAMQEQIAQKKHFEAFMNSALSTTKLKKENKKVYESQEDYINKMLQQKQNREAPKKKKSKLQNIKATIKEKVIGLVKATAITALSVAGVAGIYYGGMYVSAKSRGALDFEELQYVENTNIEAGYYNEHPIMVAISKDFSEERQRIIINTLEKIDKKAEGISINWKIDDGKKDYDCYVDETTMKGFENSYIESGGAAGLAYQNDANSAERLHGWVDINENLPSYILGSVFAHEFMHFLGVDHSKDPTSLMFPTVTRFSFGPKEAKLLNEIYPAEKEDKKEDKKEVKYEAYYTYQDEFEME